MKGITMKKLATLILATLLLAGCAKKPITTSVPPAPTITPAEAQPLTATATPHSVTLGGCTDVTAGVSFNFYKGTTPGGESSTPLNASPSATCSYVDTAVTALSTYYYVARAYLATASQNLSGPSNEVTATIPADSQPQPPTGLTVGPISQNQVPLQWQAPVEPPGVVLDAYLVMRGGEKTLPSPTQIATTRATNYTDSNPLPGKHFYAVKTKVTVNGIVETCCRSNVAEAIIP